MLFKKFQAMKKVLTQNLGWHKLRLKDFGKIATVDLQKPASSFINKIFLKPVSKTGGQF